MNVAGPGRKWCRYHDEQSKPATVARNTAALRAYWARYHLAKALRELPEKRNAVGGADTPGHGDGSSTGS